MPDTDMTARIEALIEEERQALLAGDLDRLGDLVDQKEQLFASAGSIAEHAALDRMQTNLRRNHALFDEALKGIRAVSARLAEINRLRDTLETYDASGRKSRLRAGDRGKIERRA